MPQVLCVHVLERKLANKEVSKYATCCVISTMILERKLANKEVSKYATCCVISTMKNAVRGRGRLKLI